MKDSADEIQNVRPAPAIDLDDGRDELNLAEFPLAAIADRVPDDQKTLVFEDQIFDAGKSTMITRRLTISASDKFGLPTSLDDEVILGLIKLSKQNRFTEKKVYFSRYQLIQILGWRHEGRSYDRLEKSLKRWLGVTLYYDKAWWDKDAQSWVDENFHILEHVTLYDQERRLTRLRSGNSEPPLSSFTWNDVVFRSFKSGNLKTIDLGVFRQLEYAAAKRMYRFLDKRFWHKSRWDFDLTEFACEHIGLSRNYDTGQLKRRLQPAITELVDVGFLEPLSPAQRFIKISRGQWRVVFIKKDVAALEAPGQEDALLIQRLTACGVTPSVATELVREYPSELIETQLEVLNRLRRVKSRESIRNPAGYLVKSIREGYLPPVSFAAVQKAVGSTMVKKVAPALTIDPMQLEIDAYLDKLTAEERRELELAALPQAEPMLLAGYERSKASGGQVYSVYRRMMLESAARRILQARTASAA